MSKRELARQLRIARAERDIAWAKLEELRQYARGLMADAPATSYIHNGHAIGRDILEVIND